MNPHFTRYTTDLLKLLQVEEELVELSESADDDESYDLSNISIEKQAGLTCLNFDCGIEGTPTQPCEVEFLDALIHDILVLTSLASHTLLEVKLVNMDQTLPRDTAIVATNLYEVMQQCRRLKACPELFPSLALRSEFLQKISEVSPIMALVSEFIANKLEVDGYRICDVKPADDPNEQRMPHPNMLDGKNPWNKWLDNSAEPPSGWIGIQQKIPRFGDMLMRRITLEYEAIEASFISNDFIIRDVDEPVGIQLPGHEFQHMSWSGFATVPFHYPGFRIGEGFKYDETGAFSLERINSGRILPSEPMETERELDERNFPYFRFALAGEIHEAD